MITQDNSEYKTYSGVEFNDIYKEDKFYKIMNEYEEHNDMKYKDGLNIDVKEFNPHGQCLSGGIYFAKGDIVYTFVYIGPFIREVTIPNDARVHFEGNKFKADRVILGPRRKLTYNDYLEAVQCRVHNVQFVPEIYRTEELYIAAASHMGCALKYISEISKTKKVCETAIRSYAGAIKYIPEKLITKEMCIDVVKRYKHSLVYIPKEYLDENMCSIAINNGDTLKCVPKEFMTKELCMIGIEKNNHNLYYTPREFRTRDLCSKAIKYGNSLRLVPRKFHDEDMYLTAVSNNHWNLQYIPKHLRTAELCIIAVRNSKQTSTWRVNKRIMESVPNELRDQVIESLNEN
jgi:hypothetical protein